MLALVFALAATDPSISITPMAPDAPSISTTTSSPATPREERDAWRALAFADFSTGALGVEAPLGPLYVGGGAFGGGSRNATSFPNTQPQEFMSARVGALAWLQGRFLDLDVVDLSWATRLRGGWALSEALAEEIDARSTSTFVSGSLGLVADARIVDGVALRIGVDVVEAGMRTSESSAADFRGTGDDVELSFLSPQAGFVVDLM